MQQPVVEQPAGMTAELYRAVVALYQHRTELNLRP